MSEPLYAVQYLFRPGAGISPEWREYTSHLPEGAAEKLCTVLRNGYDSGTKMWRIVPIKVRFKGRIPVPDVTKAMQRSFRAGQDTKYAAYDAAVQDGRKHLPAKSLNADFGQDRHGRLTIRMGGAR